MCEDSQSYQKLSVWLTGAALTTYHQTDALKGFPEKIKK